jgi:hypothetical protein
MNCRRGIFQDIFPAMSWRGGERGKEGTAVMTAGKIILEYDTF